MPSGLRAKLNALKRETPASPLAPKPALVVRDAYAPLAEALRHMTPIALERMGFAGEFDLNRALFLDTETTGLSGGVGTVVFLLGIGFAEGERLHIRQYLIPNYAAEPLMMQALSEALVGRDTLITFNGKTFDVPMLRSRLAMCRMDTAPLDALRQLDLIIPSRRVWKNRLRCSLSQLEEQVLGQPREHDLPGSEAPARYFAFLKSGDMTPLEEVIDHNRQDVISLASLLLRLSQVYAAPTEQTSLTDVFSIGRVLERRGERNMAQICYRMAAKPRPMTSLTRLRERKYAGEANLRLSLLLKRDGCMVEAEQIWREMIERHQMGILPYEELAKRLEHVHRDLVGALCLTEQALALTKDTKERMRLIARRERLLKKGQNQ